MSRTLPPVLADMAPLLGLSRPAAQCLGTIWRAAQAPSADDLVAGLGLSRSNVSVALKELRGLGLIQSARSPGSRRDYFVAEADPWMILRQIIAERQRRELAALVNRLAPQAGDDPRIAPLAEVAAAVSGWMHRLAHMDPAQLARDMVGEPPRKKKKKKP